jgi:hypothetical protein
MAAADVTLDGRDDLLVGSSSNDLEIAAGKATLVKTETLEPGTTWTISDDVALFARFITADPTDHFGYPVAMGDVNGDAYIDAIIAAQMADEGEFEDCGAVYVVRGPLGYSSEVNVTDRAGVTRFHGQGSHTNYGRSIAVARWDADIYADIFVAAGDDWYDVSTVAQVHLLKGTPSWCDGNVAIRSASVTSWVSSEWEDGFGEALCVADVTGDGARDLVVGAPFHDALGRYNAGATFAFYGEITTEVSAPAVPRAALTSYPNPFSSHTSITVIAAHDVVDIFDVRGSLVVSLEAGATRSAEWDGKDRHQQEVPAGAYFARLRGKPTATPAKIVRIR